MRVLIACEDPTHDAYIAQPIVEFILKSEGLAGNVDVCRDPYLTGIESLVDKLPSIVSRYYRHRLIVVVIDRDANRPNNNEDRLRHLLELDDRLVGTCAVEEIEAWMLALHRGEIATNWQGIRAERDVKRHYALPFLRGFCGPGGGRKAAMKATPSRLKSLFQLCPEIDDLRRQIRRVLSAD